SNVVLYSITGIIMLAISWRPFIYSLRWFATWWWVKVLLLPVVWLGTLLLTTLLLVISGHESSVSANQEAVEQAAGESSLLVSIVILGLVGPFVEEYIFRHLLIGKLSHWIPTWITAPISVIAFALLHFIGDPNTSWASVLPYISMAVAFTTVYLISKKSFAYAWLSHAFNNVVSVLLMQLTALDTGFLTISMIGRLGAAELARVGLATAIVQPVTGLLIFLSYSTPPAVARFLGAGQLDKALGRGRDAIRSGLGLGIVLAVIGWFAAPQLAHVA